MSMTKHYCKRCFKSVIDRTASDRFLLMSGEKMKCPSCGQVNYLVAAYFKWGEHIVTPDGKDIVGSARHVGINPNYSHFENNYPYAE